MLDRCFFRASERIPTKDASRFCQLPHRSDHNGGVTLNHDTERSDIVPSVVMGILCPKRFDSNKDILPENIHHPVGVILSIAHFDLLQTRSQTGRPNLSLSGTIPDNLSNFVCLSRTILDSATISIFSGMNRDNNLMYGMFIYQFIRSC